MSAACSLAKGEVDLYSGVGGPHPSAGIGSTGAPPIDARGDPTFTVQQLSRLISPQLYTT